jgi:hypothetical protein
MAWGAGHFEKERTLADDKTQVRFDPKNDGSVHVRFQTYQIQLGKGYYQMDVQLTAEEIDKLYRRSMAGSAKGAVQETKTT